MSGPENGGQVSEYATNVPNLIPGVPKRVWLRRVPATILESPLIRVAGVDMNTFTEMRGWRGATLAGQARSR